MVISSIRKALAACGLASLAFLTACGGGSDAPDLATLAKSDPQFSILAEALTAAGLDATLAGPDALTVFAPTNAAFTALLGELGVSKAQLLSDRALLTAVLSYHVLPGKVPKASVPLGKAITTAQGGFFKIEANGSALTVQDGRNRISSITATDVDASNGVLHVVDKVLLPANRNIVQTAQALPEFSILVEAVVAANLQGALSGTGPFTVFAPTNAAFASLLAELGVTKQQLLANTTLLTSVLKYHVVPARVLRAEVPVGTPIATLETGKTFRISSDLTITDANNRRSNIGATDVFTSNGVIHVIDKVILP